MRTARHDAIVGLSAATLAGLALVAACRDPNPLFDEPPFATTTTLTSPTTTEALTDTASTTDEAGTATTNATGGSISSSATDTGTSDTEQPTATTDPFCAAGEIRCDGLISETCDGNGGVSDSENCGTLCEPGLGCVDCSPGISQCAGDLAQFCDDDGTWVTFEDCDPIQGLACDPALGACLGACAAINLTASHLGCEFYAVTLPSVHSDEPPQWTGEFAAVIVNDGADDAIVRIFYDDMELSATVVFAGTAEIFELPYVDALVQPDADAANPTQKATDGAYHIRSDRPVAAYQFEPIAYQDSGDASLLLPVHTWGTDHVVASFDHYTSVMDQSLPGYYAVVASEDDTTVIVTPSASGDLVYAGAGVDMTGDGVVNLDAGDVLEVFSLSNEMADETDLSGTRVVADKPVAVLSGHKCAEIPFDSLDCDHLEEQMPPIPTLGTDYVVAAPDDSSMVLLPTIVRVIATEDATAVATDPVKPPIVLDNAGDYFDLYDYKEGQLTADKKILVVQYISSANNAFVGASMLVATPVEQFRDTYRVFASNNFLHTGVTLIALSGTTVQRDGMPLMGWTTINGTDYSALRVVLDGSDDGSYMFEGDGPFGISIHGTAPSTSYWIPGGLGLAPL